MSAIDEHDLIARHFRDLARAPAALQLTDDAAVLTPPAGCDLVLTKDGIAAGVHFPDGEAGDAVAHRALAVNLSDLAAMGADPLGYLVLLGLPADWSEAWVASFADALRSDQATFAIALYGGDTIRTEKLTVAITAIGTVPAGRAVRRSGARAGDVVCVSGPIGDAALGLRAWRGELDGLSPDHRSHLIGRYRTPRPRCRLAPVLREFADAAIDISDGLVGDLDKLCAASGVAARIEAARVPLSEAARAAVEAEPALLAACLTGGDDYEILCAVPPDRLEGFRRASAAAGAAAAAIGEITTGPGPATVVDPTGAELHFAHRSFSHTG